MTDTATEARAERVKTLEPIITLTKLAAMESSEAANKWDGAPGSKALAFADANDALNEIGKLNERFEDRLTLGNLALAERYVRGDLKILIEARWSSIDFNLVFQRKDPNEIIGSAASDHKGTPAGATAANRHFTIGGLEQHGHANLGANLNECAAYDYDGIMLVDDIKLMQYPECIVGSFATFQPKEKPLGSGIDALYFGYTSGFKSFGLPFDWKPTPTIWHSFSDTNAVANQVIENTPEIVNDIPDDGAYLDWDRFIEQDAVNILSGLKIFLSADIIRTALVKGMDSRLKLLNVAFGPFNF